MRTEKLGDGRFFHFTPGDGEHEFCVIILFGRQANLVQRQKHVGGNGANAFVAINERMILNQMEQIRRGHFIDVRVEKLTAKGGGRHRKRRLQQPPISHADRAAIAFDLVAMDFGNFVESQEARFQRVTPQAA